MRWLLLPVFVAACALHTEVPPDRPTIPAITGISGCRARPAGRVANFRHTGSRLFAGLGAPRHRGVDLIAVESDEKQTVAGKLAYTSADKDLEHEDVIVYACVDDVWQELGDTSTDGNGRFQLTLTGKQRLPAGTRKLFAHVVGDGSGVEFVAYVARADESVIVTDIDGTLTESENAILNSWLFGDDIGNRRGAPAALAQSGHQVVYVTARGDQFTELTRRWLHDHGFPPGPIRLSSAAFTPPGSKAVAFKANALRDLGVPINAAIGNKHTDVEAYEKAGVPRTRIFMKLPEFEGELREDLAARRATGFDDYRKLPPLLRMQ
jgi:phosphatidate phosphatase PAH1